MNKIIKKIGKHLQINRLVLNIFCGSIFCGSLYSGLLLADKAADEESMSKPERPHWSFDIKAGRFTPELEQWSEYYGNDDSKQLSAALSYKFFRSLEAGAELSYIKDKGVGRFPMSDITAGSVEQQLYPVHLFLLYRAIFNENQFFVPYIGLGYTQVYYRQKIESQPASTGDTDGQHIRAGLQILLDGIDPGGSASMETDFDVSNSYITVEVQELSAEIEGIDLGGKSITVGFLFEF